MGFHRLLLFIFIYLVRSNLKMSIDRAVASRLFEYSSPLLLANLANFLYGQADLLVLMIMMIPVVVGVYQVAVTVSGLLGAILITTITATIQPVAAKRFGSSGKSGLESVLAKTSRYLAFVYVPAAFGLAAFAGTAINLMAGQRYLEATTPLAVISLVSIASGLYHTHHRVADGRRHWLGLSRNDIVGCYWYSRGCCSDSWIRRVGRGAWQSCPYARCSCCQRIPREKPHIRQV